MFSVSLIYISDFVPVPYYFEYCSSVVQSEVREINSSDSSFLSEDCLAIHNFLDFHKNCNLDSILKSRDITLPTKVRLVKVMVFPVVMYGCENLRTKELKLLNCGVGEDS